MSRVALPQVQAWLAKTKVEVSSLDAVLESHVWSIIEAHLRGVYPVENWTDQLTTPEFIKTIISGLVAAYEFQRTYHGQEGAYGQRLEERMTLLLMSLADGSIDLEDLRTGGLPGFWPTDQATTFAQEDPNAPNAAPRAFSMGKAF